MCLLEKKCSVFTVVLSAALCCVIDGAISPGNGPTLHPPPGLCVRLFSGADLYDHRSAASHCLNHQTHDPTQSQSSESVEATAVSFSDGGTGAAISGRLTSWKHGLYELLKVLLLTQKHFTHSEVVSD